MAEMKQTYEQLDQGQKCYQNSPGTNLFCFNMLALPSFTLKLFSLNSRKYNQQACQCFYDLTTFVTMKKLLFF